MTATATVTTAIRSEVVEAGETNQDITHIGLWGGVDGSGDPENFITSFALTNNPDPTVLGQTLVFAANSIVITVNITDVSDYGDELTLRGWFAQARRFTYHTGAPGANGAANRVTGLAPTEVPTASLTFAH